jgi:hypothetical protein
VLRGVAIASYGARVTEGVDLPFGNPGGDFIRFGPLAPVYRPLQVPGAFTTSG